MGHSLRLFAGALRRNSGKIWTFLFFAALLLIFIFAVIGAKQNTNEHDDSVFQEEIYGLVSLSNGFSTKNNADTTLLIIKDNPVTPFYPRFLFVYFMSLLFFSYQLFRNKKLSALPITLTHLPFMAIYFYSAIKYPQVFSLFNIYRRELSTFRGACSVILYAAFLFALLLYFLFELRRHRKKGNLAVISEQQRKT